MFVLRKRINEFSKGTMHDKIFLRIENLKILLFLYKVLSIVGLKKLTKHFGFK